MAVIAAALRELIALGLEGEELIAAIARIEAADKPKRSKHAEAQARYRAKNQPGSGPDDDGGGSRVIRSDHRDHESHSRQKDPRTQKTSSSKSPLSPPTGALSPVTGDRSRAEDRAKILEFRTRRRGSRIADDWSLSAAGRAFAEGHGVTGAWLDFEVEKFVAHHRMLPGPKGFKADWDAAWESWVLEAVRRGPPKQIGGTTAQPSASSAEAVFIFPGTPQWAAWERHYGRKLQPVTYSREHDAHGRLERSEFPPTGRAA